MQGYAFNRQATAGAGELRCPVCFAHWLEFGKERTRLRQRLQDGFKLLAKADYGRGSGLVAVEADDLGLPVDVLGGQARHVGLSAAQVPAKLIERPALRVHFGGDNGLVFLHGDRPLFLEADFRPSFLGENGPRQPTHVEGEIVNPAQKHVRRHGTGVEDFQELGGVGCGDYHGRLRSGPGARWLAATTRQPDGGSRAWLRSRVQWDKGAELS